MDIIKHICPLKDTAVKQKEGLGFGKYNKGYHRS